MAAIYADLNTDIGELADPPPPDLVLGEDFSGAAAIARAWADRHPKAHAVAVDRDPEAHAHATPHPRVRLITADVTAVRAKVDIIAALNFSVCERLTRAHLLDYLAAAKRRLSPRGCFVCDLYGGSDAYFTGTITETFRLPAPDKRRVTYHWQQRHADPLLGRVENAMHFEIGAGKGRPALRIEDAFVYRWRLWSCPELRDALLEVGFREVRFYPRSPDAIDQDGGLYVAPVDDPAELPDAFNLFVAAQR